MGVVVEQREEVAVVTVFTARGFDVWLVTEDARTLLERVDLG